jgi:drug/metabolite transporter (DMT)-like permease
MLTTWLTIIFIVLTDTVGDVCVTLGMKQIGRVSSLRLPALLRLIGQLILNPMLIVGLLSSACSFVLFLWLLSWTDLSFALPATALVYVLGTISARYVLHENVTPARWIGSCLVALGVALISVD